MPYTVQALLCVHTVYCSIDCNLCRKHKISCNISISFELSCGNCCHIADNSDYIRLLVTIL